MSNSLSPPSPSLTRLLENPKLFHGSEDSDDSSKLLAEALAQARRVLQIGSSAATRITRQDVNARTSINVSASIPSQEEYLH